MEAARLAQQIASERFLPISARHYEAFLNRRRSDIAYDRADLEPVWVKLLAEAVAEVETVRDPDLIKRLQAEAKAALEKRYGPVQAAPNPLSGQVPPIRR